MRTTLAFSFSVSMFSCFHHCLKSFCISFRLSSCISFRSSVGISSGPGAFLLFSFLIALVISASDGYSVLYSSKLGSIIGSVTIVCSPSSFVPHCFH